MPKTDTAKLFTQMNHKRGSGNRITKAVPMSDGAYQFHFEDGRRLALTKAEIKTVDLRFTRDADRGGMRG